MAAQLAAAEGDAPEAFARLDAALTAQGARTAKDLVDLAQYAWTAGRLDESLGLLDQVPGNTDARAKAAAIFLRVRCLARLGRIDDARAAIR